MNNATATYSRPINDKSFATVRLTRCLMFNTTHYQAGATVTVSVDRAKAMIEAGQATRALFDASAVPPPPAKKAYLTADHAPGPRTASLPIGLPK